MIQAVKEKLLSGGMAIMQHPAVGKLMESELLGTVVEKAISIPVKISGAIDTHRERLSALLDLATQKDVDELKMTISRIEDALRDIKKRSDDLLRQTDAGNDSDKKTIVE